MNTAVTRTGLLSLPDELLDTIFHLVVPCGKVVDAWKAPHPFGRKHDGLLVQEPALAATCHSIRRIVLPIYYGENGFDMTRMAQSCTSIERLRETLGPRASMVRHILVELMQCEASANRKIGLFRRVFIQYNIVLRQGGILEVRQNAPHFQLCPCNLRKLSSTSAEAYMDGNRLFDAALVFRVITQHAAKLGHCAECSKERFFWSNEDWTWQTELAKAKQSIQL